VPHILVVAPNWIGDALMCQPLLARLRERHPAQTIDVLAPRSVAAVFKRMPEVREVIAADFAHGALQLRERWRVARGLRARGYAQAFVLPNSWKSALVPFLARIPRRVGYVGEARYGLLNLRHRAATGEAGGEREAMARHYARLAEAPGGEPAAPLPEPRLKIDSEAAARTARRFGFAAAPRRNAVLCPGAEYGPAKRWPAESYGRLAAMLGERGYAVWLLGARGDTAACEDVLRASGGRATSLAGKTTLDEAIELIARADLVVSNDSGLMHIAAALQVPQVAIFGSSSPLHTPPLSARAKVIWLRLECSPCFERECPLGHLRCLRDIAAERVLEEIGRLGVLS
jgi:heptosyltransferase-2